VTKSQRESTLKDENLSFGSQFQKLQSMVDGPYCFEPVVAHYIMAGSTLQRRPIQLMVTRKPEERQEGARVLISPLRSHL
jgi:hypothetical protein